VSSIESLLNAFTRFVALPWKREIAGHEKVWMCLYEPRDERRLLAQLTNFEIAAKTGGHKWLQYDLSQAFGEWLSGHEYRDSYFASPDLMDSGFEDFAQALAATVRSRIDAADENTLVVLIGAGSLFGLTSVSHLVDAVAPGITGRLAVFFPGHRNGNNYRLLDARDGWNYLAVPIEGEVSRP
jgi:hypothetical protein